MIFENNDVVLDFECYEIVSIYMLILLQSED